MKSRIPIPSAGALDVSGITEAFARRLRYSVGRDEYTVTDYDVYQALAFSVRDQLMARWFVTQQLYYKTDVKRVYYLSLEFLLGRLLRNNILNLGAPNSYALAMEDLGYKLEEIETEECDAGLGNGGLGRLAACLLDSAATLELPVYGYGIRYEYGIFQQGIVDGFQVEHPDNWLRYGNPWEIQRPDVVFPVKFYGTTTSYIDKSGHERYEWKDTQDVFAMAYDMPVIGYRNDIVNTLRLWAAKSSREFDLARFNAGDYVLAVEDRNQSENISKVLYPPDDQYAGKELRLKQQYFFVSATLQDVIRRFLKKRNRNWEEFPDKVAIQLNDTHPAIAIPELMRVLMDERYLEWEQAWEITEEVFGYTNHTILAEALEAWPLPFLGRLLPRHLQIVREIDRRLRDRVVRRYGQDSDKVNTMAIVDDNAQVVRMANLAVVGSHSVNGVAALHTEIIKDRVFRDFNEFFPGRFNNKTNGITPRRWLQSANRPLADLITEAIGEHWTIDLGELKLLEKFSDDASFRERWRRIKVDNKRRFASFMERVHEQLIDPEMMLDVQVKRIHEYKRQLLNALHAISLYNRIMDGEDVEPRTIVIGGKAAPAYFMAKLIIKLITSIGAVVAAEPLCRGKLRVAFIPNYDVSTAEMIFPATELSEQISTAGTEASGTGNMKAALNGALIIGTLDGANIEIREEIGPENMFIFGHTADEIQHLAMEGYDPRTFVESTPSLRRALDTIRFGALAHRHGSLFDPVVDIVERNDRYYHCADFALYDEAQRLASATYQNKDEWVRRSILSVARMGKFSSDRTMRQYADEIWQVQPVVVQQE